MKKVIALGLSLGLVSCNCSDDGGGAQKPSPEASKSLSTVLATLPGEGTVLALAAHDAAGMITGLDGLATRLLGPVTDVAAGRAKMKEQLGFDPATEAGWAAAGVNLQGGLGVWYGGSGERSDWQALISLGVADKAKVIETAKRLAQREGAMTLGKAVAHDGGEWMPFERTIGQRTIVSGGLFLKGDRAIISGGDLKSLDGLAAGKPRLDKEANLADLLKKLPGLGQGVFYGSARVSELDGDMPKSPALSVLSAQGFLSNLSVSSQRIDADSIALYSEEGAKKLAAMVPKPLAIPTVPAGSALAWAQSFSVSALLDVVTSIPQFATAWTQVEAGLKPLELDAKKDFLAHLGTTYSAWLGMAKEPTSLLTLMASAFVGFDVAGGNPQALVDTVKTVIEKAGAPVPGLVVQDNGFDFSHEMGKVTLRADSAAKQLSLRFGAVPTEGIEAKRPAAKALKLGGTTSSSFWIDFQALSSALKAGSSMLAASPVGPIAGKAGEVLGQLDYATATGGLNGRVQGGHFSLVLKDQPAAK